MNNNGFGFGFGFGGNGDDDDRNNNNDPFGAFGGGGGLGDMLNQFGQMLSGMGNSMNSPEGQGAVNYELATKIARQQIGTPSTISSSEKSAVEDSVRLVEMWIDDATILPASGNSVVSWNEEQWLSQTLPMWKRMVTPVAENMNEAQLDSMPEEARQMAGPMLNVMNSMNSMNHGMQLGNSLGDLAKQALTGSDFSIPLAPAGVTAILPENFKKVSEQLGTSRQDALIYLCAREAARQRLFRHVPWLTERIVASVEEYAQGLVIDTSHIEEAMREMNLESGDPMAIQDAMEKMQNLDMSPRISSRNEAATYRLETLLALVEGWVEYVVSEALGERIPSTKALAEAWARRRSSGGSAEKAFTTVVGIEIEAPRVAEAVELWRRVTVAVGAKRRDGVWEHPDFLPTHEDLDSSAEFIDGLLDDGGIEDFDPIAEITKLEEMLAQEGSEDRKENPTSTDSEDSTDSSGDEESDEDKK